MLIVSVLYSWLPVPLNLVVIAAFGVFGLIVIAKIVKIIIDLVAPFISAVKAFL